MRTLNDPIGLENSTRQREWTPLSGMLRAAWLGLIVAAVLAALLAPLAAYLPFMVAVLWMRVPLAFGLGWILAQCVNRAAGMVGWPCSLLTLVLTALVLVSNHLLFAICGVPDCRAVDPWWVPPMTIVQQIVPLREGMVIGWEWLHPYALVTMNLVPLGLGGGICVAVSGRG